jgi:hypothetical protein
MYRYVRRADHPRPPDHHERRRQSSPSPSSSTVAAVPYTELKTFLPAAPGGWQLDDKNGVTWTSQGEDWSSAWAGYSRTDNPDATAAIYI